MFKFGMKKFYQVSLIASLTLLAACSGGSSNSLKGTTGLSQAAQTNSTFSALLNDPQYQIPQNMNAQGWIPTQNNPNAPSYLSNNNPLFQNTIQQPMSQQYAMPAYSQQDMQGFSSFSGLQSLFNQANQGGFNQMSYYQDSYNSYNLAFACARAVMQFFPQSYVTNTEAVFLIEFTAQWYFRCIRTQILQDIQRPYSQMSNSNFGSNLDNLFYQMMLANQF